MGINHALGAFHNLVGTKPKVTSEPGEFDDSTAHNWNDKLAGREFDQYDIVSGLYGGIRAL